MNPKRDVRFIEVVLVRILLILFVSYLTFKPVSIFSIAKSIFVLLRIKIRVVEDIN